MKRPKVRPKFQFVSHSDSSCKGTVKCQRYQDFVIQQSRSMTTNPKDGPLNIAVMRDSRCRINAKNDTKALERRQNTSEVMRDPRTSARGLASARQSAGQSPLGNRLRVAASRDLVIPSRDSVIRRKAFISDDSRWRTGVLSHLDISMANSNIARIA